MDTDRRPETVAALAENAVGWLKPLIARAGAIITHTATNPMEPVRSQPQAVVDGLMKR